MVRSGSDPPAPVPARAWRTTRYSESVPNGASAASRGTMIAAGPVATGARRAFRLSQRTTTGGAGWPPMSRHARAIVSSQGKSRSVSGPENPSQSVSTWTTPSFVAARTNAPSALSPTPPASATLASTARAWRRRSAFGTSCRNCVETSQMFQGTVERWRRFPGRKSSILAPLGVRSVTREPARLAALGFFADPFFAIAVGPRCRRRRGFPLPVFADDTLVRGLVPSSWGAFRSLFRPAAVPFGDRPTTGSSPPSGRRRRRGCRRPLRRASWRRCPTRPGERRPHRSPHGRQAPR